MQLNFYFSRRPGKNDGEQDTAEVHLESKGTSAGTCCLSIIPNHYTQYSTLNHLSLILLFKPKTYENGIFPMKTGAAI